MKIFEMTHHENFGHKLVAIAAFVGVVIVNAMASLLPLNGKSTGEISDSYPNLFAPAGTTFSIWGVIYLLLTVYVVYQFAVIRDKQSKIKESTFVQLNQYFILSSVLNMAWIFAWHNEILWLSVILMVGILYALAVCTLLLRTITLSTWDRWAVKTPFSVYFGWITVATVANITTWLVSMNWDGFGIRPGIWAVTIIIITTAIGIATIYRLRDWVYGLVIIWALTGILVKHLSTNGWNGSYPTIIATLGIVLAVTIMTVMITAEKEYSKSA